MARISLVPQEKKFFSLFEQQAALVSKGADLLFDMMVNFKNVEQQARVIKEVENEADKITHGIITLLHRTFITPFERGDIHALAVGIDEVLDYTETVAMKFYMYEIKKPTPEAKALAEAIAKSAHELELAVKTIRRQKICQEHLIKIRELEEEADRTSRTALSRLFHGQKDPIEVIKWKDIYQIMESTTDVCEDVANIIEGILVKNA
jgi:hypothetical protein